MADGPRHGYAVAREVEELTDGRIVMGPGTLYGSLQRMSAAGLIEESANPGEDPRAMAKIASGGELSRIVLTLKELLARETDYEALVFDEVDAGIGGRTADRVGQRLKTLARRHQLICITHLPQIACYADHHYVVRKSTRKGRTITGMKKLAGEERLEEVARLLGGTKISTRTRAHAREMLEQAQKHDP